MHQELSTDLVFRIGGRHLQDGVGGVRWNDHKVTDYGVWLAYDKAWIWMILKATVIDNMWLNDGNWDFEDGSLLGPGDGVISSNAAAINAGRKVARVDLDDERSGSVAEVDELSDLNPRVRRNQSQTNVEVNLLGRI